MKVRNQFALASYIIALPYFITSQYNMFVLFIGVVLYFCDLKLIKPVESENLSIAISCVNRLIWTYSVLAINYVFEGEITGYVFLLLGLEIYLQYILIMSIKDDGYEEGMQEVFADTLYEVYDKIGEEEWQEFMSFYDSVDEEKMIKFVLMYYPNEIVKLFYGDRKILAKCINEEKYEVLNKLLQE
ncbi:MAG: hypothetical protein IKV94_03125 [Clostridia bacterium]|nr:hypothetical protein [Clostridia bacterium]